MQIDIGRLTVADIDRIRAGVLLRGLQPFLFSSLPLRH